eukprot:s529_g14.t1
MLDQQHYVKEVTTTKSQPETNEDFLLGVEYSLKARGIGSLQWMSGTTRPDIAADVSLLQKGREELNTDDLNEVNKVIRYVKATPDAGIRIAPIQPDDMILVAYGDSGFGTAPGNKSQGGFVIVATTTSALTEKTPCSVLEWMVNPSISLQEAKDAAAGNGLDADGVKLYCGQMGKNVADRAIQVMGGYGYVGEYNVERLWRDAKLLEIGGGTNEAHHKNIVRDLSRTDSRRTYTCGVLCAWAAFGFLHGGHWCVLSGMGAHFDTSDRWLPRNHAMSYVAGILVTALGGAYVQSGNAVACPNGEDPWLRLEAPVFGCEIMDYTDMSRDCFWGRQTVDYQIIYILHYIGLAWNFAHWIMDGAQLWFWAKALSDQKPLSLVATGMVMRRFIYSGILWLAVLLMTWWMDWTTGNDETIKTESTIPRLAGVLLVEIVCVLVVCCAIVRVVVIYRGGEEKVGAMYTDSSQWALPDFICQLQIPVGTAGLHLPAPDPSGHCRTSSASSRSQWALPDFTCQLQIPVGTAGLHPRAPDPSGHCRTSTASPRCQWALPDFIRELQIPVGTAGLQPRAPDSSGKIALTSQGELRQVVSGSLELSALGIAGSSSGEPIWGISLLQRILDKR